MTKRVITLRTIRAEKIDRSRSWLYGEMAAGRFPKPIPGCVPNLWDEADIDRWLEEFVERAKGRAADAVKTGSHRIARALEVRSASIEGRLTTGSASKRHTSGRAKEAA